MYNFYEIVIEHLIKKIPHKKDRIGISVGFSTNPVKHIAVLQIYSGIDPARHHII